MFELTPQNAREYLLQAGLVARGAAVEVESLGGGISNLVLKVSSPDNPDFCMVIKQPLRSLQVEDEWTIDRSRILAERDCMQMLSELLTPGSVPRILFSD